MKSRFSTVDILAMVSELRETIVGMRVVQVYDVDSKTYLFKLSRHEEKTVLLMESGIRFHKTDFAWPKNMNPSGFSMKLRKHLKNKRIEKITQLGVDRIIDVQFGINEAAYHVILELYDKGNIVLTDYDYLILNILRPRTTGTDDDVKFIVREKYPIQNALQEKPTLKEEEIRDILTAAKPGDNIKRVLNPKVIYGPAVLEHVLCGQGLEASSKIGKDVDVDSNVTRILKCLEEAESIIREAKQHPCHGYIVQKVEKRVKPAEDGSTEIVTFTEFHPFLYRQHENGSYIELPNFSAAVDQFFSSLEMQKISLRAHNQEKEALKKLENIRIDHEKRISALEQVQTEDAEKAELIEMNLQLVERSLLVLRSALANQIEWSEITQLIKEAQEQGDPVALAIRELKLDTNHFVMILRNPYEASADGPVGDGKLVDIDIDLSAYANARKYYDQKRHAAKKQQKTMESSTKAFKSAEKKTKETLKQVALTTNIARARKPFWFEKFYWFISSENYLVIGGRDAQQNEMIVKRYMKPGDIYVHADVHGASSIIIKNPGGNPVPPKTLNESGTMAICYSAAWDAKVVTSAWWVYHHQVSKTAPTGQFLTPGAFMIRGKKNYLPPSYLIMGFGFMYKLDEESMERHAGERQMRSLEEDSVSMENAAGDAVEDAEIAMSNHSSSEDEANCVNLTVESDDVEQDSSIAFPDTIAKLPYEVLLPEETEEEDIAEVVYSQPCRSAQGRSQPKPEPKPEPPAVPEMQGNRTASAPKRGTRGKLKKIKEKYKDQDEEERKLRMEILASAGAPKEPKRKGKRAKKENAATRLAHNPQPKPVAKPQPCPAQSEAPECCEKTEPQASEGTIPRDAEDEEDLQEEEVPVDEHKKLLSSLTGCPVEEDGLVFAVPVVAPYIAMQNYKHKVKVTPGTGRRGKAAKTALNVFLQDKATAPRERDLIRAIKDQDISRNIPGKVKLSAPHLQKRK